MSQSDTPPLGRSAPSPQITDEMMDAARHAFHQAIERQVPGSWSYRMRFDGAMFAALEAALVVDAETPLRRRSGDSS